MKSGNGNYKIGQVMLESIIGILCILIFLAGIVKLIFWAHAEVQGRREALSQGISYSGGSQPNLVTKW